MKKETWILIILAVVTVILVGVLLWPSRKPVKNQPQNVVGIQITSPKANSAISSPAKITGTVAGNGWAGFEGQVGTVKLLDYKGNQLGTAVLSATTDWTKLPTSFETNLNFIPNNSGPVTLVFKNENPSGDPSKDKTFTLPVKAK